MPTSESWGYQKGEEQETESLLEKIMKDNFPSLAKEIDIEPQEAQRIPNKLYQKRTGPKHIIIQLPKVKDKQRILKTRREKAESNLQRSSHKTMN